MNFCKNCEHYQVTREYKGLLPLKMTWEICNRKEKIMSDVVTGVEQMKGKLNARAERTTNDPYHCGEVGRFFQPKRKNTLEQFTNVLSNSIHKTLSFLWDR